MIGGNVGSEEQYEGIPVRVASGQLRDLESPEARALRFLANYMHDNLPWEAKGLVSPYAMTPDALVSYVITLLSVAKQISAELPTKLDALLREVASGG
jgi:hypothetical protein